MTYAKLASAPAAQVHGATGATRSGLLRLDALSLAAGLLAAYGRAEPARHQLPEPHSDYGNSPMR